MGTDLHPISNHTIIFENRKVAIIAEEIKLKLNALALHKSPFLIHHTLWMAHYYNWKETKEEILAKKDWSYHEEFEVTNFDNNKSIEFYGPFGLDIEFTEHSIEIFLPLIRYFQWFQNDFQRQRNEWRKYLAVLVNQFGGNQVIYLPGNNHQLAKYLYCKIPFHDMLKAIEKEFECEKQTFSKILNDYENSYFIDNFEDIDLNEKVDFNQFLPMDIPKFNKRNSFFNMKRD